MLIIIMFYIAFSCIGGKCVSETCDRSNIDNSEISVSVGSYCKADSDCGDNQLCHDAGIYLYYNLTLLYKL